MKKINLESIILEAYGCKDVSEFQRENDVSIQMTKEIMFEFGKRLLEIAKENAKIIQGQHPDSEYDPRPVFTYEIDNESITNTINQVE